MSIGNTNFITLDSIAEIQDIVNGDYLFTVSNGVIYKLDFQNLILTPDNVDFYTTIESLSTQVVSLTNAFSAINSEMNTLSSLGGVGSLVHAMSADWTNTHTQVKTLSAQAWLPVDSNAIKAGSLISYIGGQNSWGPLAPGLEDDTLQIIDNVPRFLGNMQGYDVIGDLSTSYQINRSTETAYVDVIPLVTISTGGHNFGYLGITWNVTFNGGEGNAITNQSVLFIQYGDSRNNQIVTEGSYSINSGTSMSYPISFTVIPQANFGSAFFIGNLASTSRNVLKGVPLGSFSALGSNESDVSRPFTNDPIIISDVLANNETGFIDKIPDAGGVPAKWRYDRITHGIIPKVKDKAYTLELWDNATTSLKVYGRPA